MHRNNGTAIRYFAALMVVIQHAWMVTGREDPLGRYTNWGIGHAGVLMFFALSGYLLMQRSRHGSLASFALARILRIFPLLVAVDLLTILVGYFFTTEPDGFFAGAIASVGNNLFSFGGLMLPGVRFPELDAPWDFVMNGSQWSVFYEMRAYLLLIGLIALGIAYDRQHFNLFFAVVLLLGPSTTWLHWDDPRAFEVTAVFLFGCFVASERWELDVRHVVLGSAAALLSFGLDAAWSRTVIFCCIAVITITLAFGRVPYVRCADRLPDLTYGIFLLHWPIMQAILHFWSMSAAVLLIATLAASICVALPLHFLIEEPARRLRPRILALLCEQGRHQFLSKLLVGVCFMVLTCYSAITAYQWRLNQIAIADATKLARSLLPVTQTDGALIGHLELLQFANKMLTAGGWAFDLAAPHRPVFVAIALDGKITAVGQTSVPRPDVYKSYNLDREAAPSGFELSTGACAADVVVFAFTRDGDTRVLPSSDGLKCPDIIKRAER